MLCFHFRSSQFPISSLTHWLFRSIFLNFYVLENFPTFVIDFCFYSFAVGGEYLEYWFQYSKMYWELFYDLKQSNFNSPIFKFADSFSWLLKLTDYLCWNFLFQLLYFQLCNFYLVPFHNFCLLILPTFLISFYSFPLVWAMIFFISLSIFTTVKFFLLCSISELPQGCFLFSLLLWMDKFSCFFVFLVIFFIVENWAFVKRATFLRLYRLAVCWDSSSLI